MVWGALTSVCLLGAGCGSEAEDICGPGNCGGCCDQFGKCLEGESKNSCGKDGESCESCDSDESCIKQECSDEACGPDNCDGCCKGGDCKSGKTSTYCGEDGETCDKCKSTETCDKDKRKCVASECNKENCADGCCDSRGICQKDQRNGACGLGGRSCISCGDGMACQKSTGSCQPAGDICNVSNCSSGCCDRRGIG